MELAAPPPSYRAGTGSPLVLLHGFTDTWRTWARVLPELEKHHLVFAPTLAGHWGGGAWTLPDPVTMDAVVADVEKLLDENEIGKAHLAGNSLGGWLALELAARGRALSVVALCPAGGWEHGDAEDLRIIKYFRGSHRMSRLVGRRADWIAKNPKLRRWAVRELVANPELVDEETVRNGIRGAANCEAAKIALRFAQTTGFGELGEVTCPVVIAWGSEDHLVRWPECYRRWQHLVPGATMVRLEGVGHLPMWEDPGLVATTILEVTLANSS